MALSMDKKGTAMFWKSKQLERPTKQVPYWRVSVTYEKGGVQMYDDVWRFYYGDRGLRLIWKDDLYRTSGYHKTEVFLPWSGIHEVNVDRARVETVALDKYGIEDTP